MNENAYQMGLAEATDAQIREEERYRAALDAGDLPLDVLRGEEPERFISETDSF